MTENLIAKKWLLITVEDPKFLKGSSIYEMMKLILNHFDFKFVVLNDVEGSPIKGKNWSLLPLKKNNLLESQEFLNLLHDDIKQLDWGDFFLFKEYPINWNNSNRPPYPYLIAQSDTTVKCVDNQYFYTYTSYEEMIELIKKNYKIESIKTAPLNELDYPC